MQTNFKKYEGFKIVKSLSEQFNDIYFYIQGGSAGYLHAMNEKNTEIELNDIDIVLKSKETTLNINTKILNYIKNNYSSAIILDNDDNLNTIYHVTIGDNIDLNFFINEITNVPNDMISINGINVEPLNATIKNEQDMLFNLTEDMNYCKIHHPEEVAYFSDKIKRKYEFLNLFTQ